MDDQNVSLFAGAWRTHVDEGPRIVSGSRSTEIRGFQIRGNDHRHEASIGGRLAEGQHGRDTLSAGLVLNQKYGIAGRVFRQILGQGSSDAVLPSPCAGTDLQDDGLPIKLRLVRIYFLRQSQ